MNRRKLLKVIGAAGLLKVPAVVARARAEAPGIEVPDATFLPLWPGEAPGMPSEPPTPTVVARNSGRPPPDRAIHGIVGPVLVMFRPAQSNGSAVIIAPGGAYRRVVIDHEGYATARWLAARGFTAFVLCYRLPGEGWAAGPNVSLSDAQRAVRVIRSRAAGFGIDAQRVSVMGFSAGGHVAADLATRFATPTYARVDAADDLSARPASAALIYPVVSMRAPIAHAVSRTRLIGADAGGELARAHSADQNVSADTPPCFLLHAEDDRSVVVEHSLQLRAALVANRVPVQTHLFARGGHGFGLAANLDAPVRAWPDLWMAWARAAGGG